MEHIRPHRLLEVVEKDVRLTLRELEHIENCTECVYAFSKSILQVAKERAKKKTRASTKEKQTS